MARERLGELLLRSGVLTQAHLVAALREQARTGVRLGQILVDHGYVEEATLYDGLAKMTGLERFNLRTAILEKSSLNLVTAEWAFEQGIAPFKVDVQTRTLHVALTDPTNLKPVDELAFRHGLKIKMFVASETELQRVLRNHFYGEPLERDPRNVNRPGAPRTGSVDIDPSLIIVGMDKERDEVLSRSGPTQLPPPLPPRPPPLPHQRAPEARPSQTPFPAPPPPPPPPQTGEFATQDLEDIRAALARLKPIFDTQEEAARALRAIFELCVARGIIRREEYLERLRRAPD